MNAQAPQLHHYAAILADPPWTFATYSARGKGRSAEAHYDCMTVNDIKALSVAEWAAPDCALFISLPQALDVIASWGFVYKTVAFTWVKTTKNGAGFPVGCGYWTRANPEQCLLATRGRPQRLLRSVRQLILAPRRLHSQKPDETRERIEALIPGPYLELFTRERRPGWDCWGSEVAEPLYSLQLLTGPLPTFAGSPSTRLIGASGEIPPKRHPSSRLRPAGPFCRRTDMVIDINDVERKALKAKAFRSSPEVVRD